MKALLIIGVILLEFLSGSATWAAPRSKSCPTKMAAIQKGSEKEYTSIYFTSVELGNHDKYISKDSNGVRHIVALESEHSLERYHSVENTILHRQARLKDGAYYAEYSISPTGETSTILYSLDSGNLIDRRINKHIKVVWSTYLNEGTVTAKEIKGFEKQEKLLAPQRKVSFALEDAKTGETVSFMRVYDGTPFPTTFFGEYGSEFEGPKTDPRVMIEHRYPEHNFRSETEYIFEAGRLAKKTGVKNALERQFYSYGKYLHEKHGFLKTAPETYWNGRVLIEITGRNLEKFLTPRSEGGYGFKMEYTPPVAPGTSPKYTLYCKIKDFINNFYLKNATLKDPAVVYKDLFENPPEQVRPKMIKIPTDGGGLYIFGRGALNLFKPH